jgi:hypothetical protein
MRQDPRDYYLKRERAERAAAKGATCEAARRAHQELAMMYQSLSRNGTD